MIFETRTGLSRRRNKTHRDLRVESLEPRMLLACNVISGFVYNDANNNGLFDPGESPIANSTIELRNASGVVVGRTTTDASGAYRFDTDQTINTAPASITQTVRFAGGDAFTLTDVVNQFNPDLGTLTSVEIVSQGFIQGQIKSESLEAEPVQITANINGTLNLNSPGVGIVAAQIDESRTFNASAFDGILDFAGTSGIDFGSIRVNNTETATLTSASDLAAYTGTGTITFTLSGLVATSGTGAANLANERSASAGADVTVIYRYTPSNCLSPGDYTIVQTTQPPGFTDGLESRDGVVIPGSNTTDVIPVTLGNVDLPNNNFGEVTSPRHTTAAGPGGGGAEQPLGLRLFRREQQWHLRIARIRNCQRDGDLEWHGQPGPVGHPRDDDRLERLLLIHHASPRDIYDHRDPADGLHHRQGYDRYAGRDHHVGTSSPRSTCPRGWTASSTISVNCRARLASSIISTSTPRTADTFPPGRGPRFASSCRT